MYLLFSLWIIFALLLVGTFFVESENGVVFFYVVSISAIWVSVWYSMYRTASTLRTLPFKKILVILSTSLIASITVFYTLLYSSLWSPITIELAYPHTFSFYTGTLLLCFGTLLTHASIKTYQHLTPGEILYSLSPTIHHTKLHSYFSHPMYCGFGSILVGSFTLIPALTALPVLLVAFLLMICKSFYERVHKSSL